MAVLGYIDHSVLECIFMFLKSLYWQLKLATILILGVGFSSHLYAFDSSDDILIGLDADMSSVAKEGGIAISRGAQLAIDEINANGGVLGKSLRLLSKDHRGNPARGIKNIQSFAAMPNLAAVIGGVHTPVALAELPSIHENKIIYLGAWAAGTSVVDNGYSPNYVFRVSIRDIEAGEALMRQAMKQGANKIALALERTGWGRSNLDSITRAAQKHGIEISAITWINWRQTDFTNEMQRIKNSSAQAVLLVTNAPEGAVVVKHMLKLDSNLPIIAHWGIAGGKFVELTGLDNIAKLDIFVLQTFHFAGANIGDKGEALFQAYQSAYGEQASYSSIPAAVGVAQAYDLVHMLALAIKDAGTIDSEQVRAAFLRIQQYNGAVKNYQRPFTVDSQDALLLNDYFMTFYDDTGYLQPVNPS